MKFKIGDLFLILLALLITIGGFIYIYIPRHYDSKMVARVSYDEKIIMVIDFKNLAEEIKDDSLDIKIKLDNIKQEKRYELMDAVILANHEGISAYDASEEQKSIKEIGEEISLSTSLIKIQIVDINTPVEEEKLIARVEYNKKIVLEIDFKNLKEEIKDEALGIKIEYDKANNAKYYTFKARISEITISATPNGVSVKESGCPDHVCIKTGIINVPGRPIACMPNKVLITIVNQEEALG